MYLQKDLSKISSEGDRSQVNTPKDIDPRLNGQSSTSAMPLNTLPSQKSTGQSKTSQGHRENKFVVNQTKYIINEDQLIKNFILDTRRKSERPDLNHENAKALLLPSQVSSKQNIGARGSAYEYKTNLRIPNFDKALQNQIVEERQLQIQGKGPKTIRQKITSTQNNSGGATKTQHQKVSSIHNKSLQKIQMQREGLISPRQIVISKIAQSNNFNTATPYSQSQLPKGLATSQSVISFYSNQTQLAGKARALSKNGGRDSNINQSYGKASDIFQSSPQQNSTNKIFTHISDSPYQSSQSVGGSLVATQLGNLISRHEESKVKVKIEENPKHKQQRLVSNKQSSTTELSATQVLHKQINNIVNNPPITPEQSQKHHQVIIMTANNSLFNSNHNTTFQQQSAQLNQSNLSGQQVASKKVINSTLAPKQIDFGKGNKNESIAQVEIESRARNVNQQVNTSVGNISQRGVLDKKKKSPYNRQQQDQETSSNLQDGNQNIINKNNNFTQQNKTGDKSNTSHSQTRMRSQNRDVNQSSMSNTLTSQSQYSSIHPSQSFVSSQVSTIQRHIQGSHANSNRDQNMNSSRSNNQSQQALASQSSSNKVVFKKNFAAPISKIDLATSMASSEGEVWKEILKFFNHWLIPPIKLKNTYTKAEVLDLIRVFINKISDLDRLTNYERQKADEFKEEGLLLREQIEAWKDQYSELQNSIVDVRKEFLRHQEMIVKMEECQQELKQTLLNSLMCLDFYKDLENYIQENRYSDQSPEIIQHFDVISELISQHGLYSLDFDTERIQLLIDQIQDYIKVKDVEQKIVQIQMNDQALLSDDDEEYTREGLKLKVKRLTQNDKPGSMGLVGAGDKRLSNQSRFTNSRLSAANTGPGVASTSQTRGARHTSQSGLVQLAPTSQCVCNGNQLFQQKHLKDEIKDKNAIINRMREQLEHKMKKIIELKFQLKRERDKDFKVRQHLIFKDSIVKLEKDYNQLVIKNTKTQLDLQTEREENEVMRLEFSKQKEMIKEYQNDLNELRKILGEQDGYQSLEATVNSLINLLVSKRNDQLTPNQRQQIKSVFGNNSMLYKLRQRVQAAEEHVANLSQAVTNSIKLNLNFQDIIEDQWATLRQVYQAFRETSFDQLENLNLMLLMQVLQPHLSEEYCDQSEREYASLLVQFKEVRALVTKDSMVEEMSKVLATSDDKDRINLLQMVMDSQSRKNLGPITSRKGTREEDELRDLSTTKRNSIRQDMNVLSMIETPKQDKRYDFNFTTQKHSQDNVLKSARPPLNQFMITNQKLNKNLSEKQFENQFKPKHQFSLKNQDELNLRGVRKQTVDQESSLIGGDVTDMNVQDFQTLFEQSKIVGDSGPNNLDLYYNQSQKQEEGYFTGNQFSMTRRSGSIHQQHRHSQKRGTILSHISLANTAATPLIGIGQIAAQNPIAQSHDRSNSESGTQIMPVGFGIPIDQLSQINQNDETTSNNQRDLSQYRLGGGQPKLTKKQLRQKIKDLKLQNANLQNAFKSLQKQPLSGMPISFGDMNQTLNVSQVNKVTTNDSMTLFEQQQIKYIQGQIITQGDSLSKANIQESSLRYSQAQVMSMDQSDLLQMIQIQGELLESQYPGQNQN